MRRLLTIRLLSILYELKLFKRKEKRMLLRLSGQWEDKIIYDAKVSHRERTTFHGCYKPMTQSLWFQPLSTLIKLHDAEILVEEKVQKGSKKCLRRQ